MNAGLREIEQNLAEILRPPRRIKPSEAAAQYMHVAPPGKRPKLWDSHETPYLLRPLDLLTSRRYNMIVFVGPAQCGKTLGLVLGALNYFVTCHPLDIGIVHSSQQLARDLSRRDLKRLIKNSPELHSRLSTRAADDNTFDKVFRAGNIASILWPTSSQLASRAIPIMVFTDTDRMPADVSGEGSGIAQGRKRTQSFGSLAKTLAESSPGSVISDPKWRPQTPHEPPPTSAGPRENILQWYDMGTREWWYVPCSACGEFYPQRPSIDAFSWANDDPATAGTVCPHCGALHPETEKRWENHRGVWIPDGCTIDRNGEISGTQRDTDIASFWLGGGAAALQSRQSIVRKYLHAKRVADRTGDEQTLRSVINQDIGGAYKPLKVIEQRRSPHYLSARAEAGPERVVPKGVRFLVAAVDVQHRRFVVQVQGFGPDKERWIIDRYNVTEGSREGRDGEKLRIEPASYASDWDALIEVINASYPLSDGTGRRMPVLVTGCDSGGEAGVTTKAYDFWRRLRDKGLSHKFALIKGDGRPSAPRIKERRPDSQGKNDRAETTGDVPVWFINTGMVKDTLAGDLENETPGAGYIHFPGWLGDWWYEELTREERDPSKGWTSAKKNEAWDLMVYAEALALAIKPSIEDIDWNKPPAWAAPWETNPYLTTQPAPIQRLGGSQRLSVRGN